jgi:hypothetical protein
MQAAPQVLLVRSREEQGHQLRERALRFCAATSLELRLQCVGRSDADGWTYLYAEAPAAVALEARALPRLAGLWQVLGPQARDTDVSRLECVQDLAGASEGEVATHHYVVETDPEAGWEDEIARWYAEEHLRGLAGVPGCVRARRYVNLDAGPRSHACYALVTEQALGSPPWLAVRGTPWSSRVRPHFTNTRRTMMRVVP